MFKLKGAYIKEIPEGFYEKLAQVKADIIIREIKKAPEEYWERLLDDVIAHLEGKDNSL